MSITDTANSAYAERTGFIYGDVSWGHLYHSRNLFDGSATSDSGDVGAFEREFSTMEYIDQSLAVMGISGDALKDMRVFNVGTGREALYFQRLGAREVVHLDISRQNVARVNTYLRAANIQNVKSVCADLQFVEMEPKSFDVVFLAGIYEHLADPPRGLVNVARALKIGGQMYMGWYRSGDWRWFICELARQLVKPRMMRLTQRLAALNQTLGATSHWQTSRILDDFFVPAHHEFHPADIKADAAACGLKIVRMDNDYREYSHEITPLTGEGYSRNSDILDPGKTGEPRLDYFSLGADRAYFVKERHIDSVPLEQMKTRSGIDQLNGINYTRDIEKENVQLFRKLQQYSECGYATDEEVVSIAINLYRFTRPYEPSLDSYYKATLADGRHAVLNKFLKRCLSMVNPQG
jgi:SAM-dependent methyltransferase